MTENTNTIITSESNKLDRLGEMTGNAVLKTIDVTVRTAKATQAGGSSFITGFMRAWNSKK